LTAILLGTLVLLLGAPALPVFAGLLAVAALCLKGLDALGTFKETSNI
jgi:hypothetical protein